MSTLTRPMSATPRQPSGTGRPVAPELGALCRLLRERAGVSLQEMARRAHRDASGLSRFERGQVMPRDAAALVGQYRALTDRRAQPEPQQADKPRLWPLLYLIVSIGVLVLALTATEASASYDGWVVRLWTLATIMVLLPPLVADLVANARSGASVTRVILPGASYVLALVALASTDVARFDHAISIPRFSCTLPALAIGLAAVAYRPRRVRAAG